MVNSYNLCELSQLSQLSLPWFFEVCVAPFQVWLALTEALAEMGGLYFQCGSHLSGALPHHVDPEPENLIGFRVDHGDGVDHVDHDTDAVPVELKAGEAGRVWMVTEEVSGSEILRRI